MIRILIADDTHAVRSAIRRLLNEEKDIQIVGEASNLGELVNLTRLSEPDLILLDWELSGLPGTTKTDPKIPPSKSDKRRNILLASLHQCPTHPFIIALSGHPEAEDRSRSAGADAFVFKAGPPERLILTIRSLFGTPG